MSSMGGETDLVGRDAELRHVERVLDRLLVGSGGTLAITGPAGIGKTAFAAELRRRAVAGGADVVVGRSYRFQSGLSYATLVDAFARIVREQAPDGELVRDLTSLGQLFDGLPTAGAPADPLLGRTRLATSLVTLAHRLAARRPTILVLDDVQWADEATVDLLPLLAADLDTVPLLLVLVVRTPAADADSQRALQAARSLCDDEIVVGPLDRNAVAGLVGALLGGRGFPDELVDVVLERSGGTPLFVGEIVTALVDSGGLRQAGSGWRVDAEQLPTSASGRELMSARLAACTDEELAILVPLALHGEPIPERVLVTLGVDSTLLRPLGARSLVAEEPADAGRAWRLTHPLLADVLAEQIPTVDREDWHERLARSFAATDPDRYSHHLLHAGDRAIRVVGSAADLAAELIAAANRAERKGSLLLATRYLTAGLELLRSSGADPLHAEATARLARVWSARGHHDVGEPLAREAIAEQLDLGDVRSALTSAALLGEMSFYLARDDYSWLEPVVAAATATGDDDLALRARYHEYFEHARRLSRNPEAGELHAFAERLAAGDRAQLTTRIARAIVVVAEVEPAAAALERAEEARSAALDVDDDPWFAQRCWNLYLDACLLRGDWHGVGDALGEIAAFTERHDLLENWRVRVARSQQLLFTGRPREGREIDVFYRGLVSSNLRVSSIMLAMHTACDAAVGDEQALRADVAAADELAAQIGDRDRHSADAVATARLLAGAALCDAELVAATRRPSVRPMTGSPLLPALACLRAACLLGDGAEVARITGELRRIDPDERFLPGALASLFDASVAARAGSAVDDRALCRAGETFARLGMPVYVAEVALVRHLSGAIADDALAATYDRLVADPDIDPGTVGAEIADRLGRAPSAGGHDDALSTREREVATLVMDGLTNREVADRLFISVRTVTSHLDHIYTKLGVRSRHDLATRLRP